MSFVSNNSLAWIWLRSLRLGCLRGDISKPMLTLPGCLSRNLTYSHDIKISCNVGSSQFLEGVKRLRSFSRSCRKRRKTLAVACPRLAPWATLFAAPRPPCLLPFAHRPLPTAPLNLPPRPSAEGHRRAPRRSSPSARRQRPSRRWPCFHLRRQCHGWHRSPAPLAPRACAKT
jgi:hypothetical protein